MNKLREAAKKVLFLMAGPLRGVKGRLLRKINFFKIFLKILLPFKNKHYFNLDNLSKYGHITLNISLGCYNILKNRLFYEEKKILLPLSPKGGGE